MSSRPGKATKPGVWGFVVVVFVGFFRCLVWSLLCLFCFVYKVGVQKEEGRKDIEGKEDIFLLFLLMES